MRWACLCGVVACGDSGHDAETAGSATHGSGASGSAGDEAGGETDDPAVPVCPAPDEPVVPATCSVKAPAGAFDAQVEWAWHGQDGFVHSVVTPLVANMTDDNGDGAVDLCDVPDVIVVAYPEYGNWWDGRLFVLDGATGEVQLRFDEPVWALTTPAVGDIDGDGAPEIVTLDGLGPHPIAFEHDGTVKWNRYDGCGTGGGSPCLFSGREAVALADIGSDGVVDILIGRSVLSGDMGYGGSPLPRLTDNDATTTAADLDGDGLLEVTIGWAAWSLADDPNGGELNSRWELFFENDDVALSICGSGIVVDDELPRASASPDLLGAGGGCPDFGCVNASGHPHVANLDDDPEPEIVLTDEEGISILEHDGTTKVAHQRPTGVLGPADGTDCDYVNWVRPAAMHRFSGASGIAMASGDRLAAYDGDLAVQWSASADDSSGLAGTTAFDFLGDGSAEVVYADAEAIRVLDDSGATLVEFPRTSFTLIEYPVVADVDDDGSAEIVVVSSGERGQPPGAPTVMVIGEAHSRWVPARRIWNQHTYHVTNVREDGTIPRFEPPHWQGVNTFRANTQVENGVACIPAE